MEDTIYTKLNDAIKNIEVMSNKSAEIASFAEVFQKNMDAMKNFLKSDETVGAIEENLGELTNKLDSIESIIELNKKMDASIELMKYIQSEQVSMVESISEKFINLPMGPEFFKRMELMQDNVDGLLKRMGSLEQKTDRQAKTINSSIKTVADSIQSNHELHSKEISNQFEKVLKKMSSTAKNSKEMTVTINENIEDVSTKVESVNDTVQNLSQDIGKQVGASLDTALRESIEEILKSSENRLTHLIKNFEKRYESASLLQEKRIFEKIENSLEKQEEMLGDKIDKIEQIVGSELYETLVSDPKYNVRERHVKKLIK